MSSALNIGLGPVAWAIGTAGSEPTTSMGYPGDEGVEFFPEEDYLEVKTAENLALIKQFAIDARGTLSGKMLESTMDNLERALPAASRSSNILSRAVANTVLRECSVKATTLTASGVVRTYKMLYAVAKLSSGIMLSSRELQALDVEFSGLGKGTNLWTIQDGGGDEAKTISSGTFARTVGVSYYKVAGEGGAADTLTDITGTLVDGEVIILQIATADDPITVTHGSGVIELEGAVDFVMNHERDVLWLQYNTSGTKWVEVGRINYNALG